MSEERFDLMFAHASGVTHAVVMDEVPDPGNVCLLGSERVMFSAEHLADLVGKPGARPPALVLLHITTSMNYALQKNVFGIIIYKHHG